MSVIDTLITDRTQADVSRWLTLLKKGFSAMTPEEKEEWLSGMRGAYNYIDLNRVGEAAVYISQTAQNILAAVAIYLKEKGVATAPVFQPYTAEAAEIRLPQIPDTGSSLPTGYTELEYIQSSGTQYIDTGIFPTNETTINIGYAFLSTPSVESAVFGCRNANANQIWVYYRGQASAYALRYANDTTNYTISSAANVFADISLQNGILTVNGASVSAAASMFSSTYSLYLMAVNNAGAAQYAASARLYSCKILQNDETVKNFIPCKKPDGAVGLYDTVGGQFYGNVGSGDFTAGPSAGGPITYRTVWEMRDIPSDALAQAYLEMISTLRGLLQLPDGTPGVPADLDALTWEEANAIETILLTVYNALIAWQQTAEDQADYISGYSNQLISGTFYAGNYRTLQHFSRGH